MQGTVAPRRDRQTKSDTYNQLQKKYNRFRPSQYTVQFLISLYWQDVTDVTNSVNFLDIGYRSSYFIEFFASDANAAICPGTKGSRTLRPQDTSAPQNWCTGI